MNVQPVNDTNFQGRFLNNRLLGKSLEKANNYELMRFSQILDRMAAVDDNASYYLKERHQFLADTRMDELLIMNGATNKFVTPVSHDNVNLKSYIKPSKRYENALKRINDFLENLYPKENTVDVPRQVLLDDIKKKL